MLALVLPLFAALSSAGTPAALSSGPTGLGVIAAAGAANAESSLIRGSSERVHIVFPLLCGAGEIEAVVIRSRTSGHLLAPRYEEHWLEITLCAEAAETLAKVSRQEIGGRLALVVRGEVVAQVVVTAPITMRIVAMHGFRDRETAKSAAKEIEAVRSKLKASAQ